MAAVPKVTSALVATLLPLQSLYSSLAVVPVGNVPVERSRFAAVLLRASVIA
jgi:hypothetical protein